MKKILILINTYERPDFLLNLLKDINSQKKGYDINLYIFDDNSLKNYNYIYEFLDKYYFNKSTFIKINIHQGKKSYWKIINYMFSYIKNINFDYVYQLPDDIRLTPFFFKKSIKFYNSIKDNKFCCLNILNDTDRYKKNFWTNFKIEKIKIGHNIFWKTGWVDMCYIANKTFFETLNWKILPVKLSWSNSKNLSSGVGKQISERIIFKNKYFYQVNHSLVIHDNHKSIMHPKERIKTPLITNNNHEPIYACVASFNDRINSLKDTIDSIINQVDKIFIYLNNYKTIPNYLINKKIKIFKSEDEIGNIGDVGKFFNIENLNGYIFTIDDDIIYPDNYVYNLCYYIDKFKRKNIVTLHGRIFNSLPVKSYYHDFSKAFSCLDNVIQNTYIHIAGTGVLAFHTDTIKLKLNCFKTSNMADIWFSKFCQEQKIPIICLKHRKGYIKLSKNFNKDLSIYNVCNNDDKFQTKIINSINWKFFNS